MARPAAGARGRAAPFDAEHRRYEAWFDRHRAAYLSELLAIRTAVPMRGRGLEIGVGSGRFAAPLGVGVGLDPSAAMLRYARDRDVAAVQGVAEALPFRDTAFDYALVVTTICFVDSAADMMREAHRVLRPGGRLIIGFVDAASELGKRYEAARAENPFYREATFYSASEVARLLRESGFRGRFWMQTLTCDPESMQVLEPALAGHGRGGFVVVVASRDGWSRPRARDADRPGPHTRGGVLSSTTDSRRETSSPRSRREG